MPERPEKDPIPDMKKEFAELREAQTAKVEAQKKSKVAEFERAQQKVYEEAEDILRIAREYSPDPVKFILQVADDYAKEESISFLAAGARIGQYLSPEWKRKVDKAVREYFEEVKFSDFAKSSTGNNEIETLKILSEEGYSSFLVVAAHYPNDIEGRKKAFDSFFRATKLSRAAFDEFKKDSFERKELIVLDPGSNFPEAKKYIEKIKKEGSAEEYENLINLIYMHRIFSMVILRCLPEFDCNERTILFQKMANDAGIEVGNYIETVGHAALKLDGYPLVFDPFDMKIRTSEECARQVGYHASEGGGSYFYRDREGEYLAEYDDSNKYPKKIIGYRKVEQNATPIGSYDDICGVLNDVALGFLEKGDDAGARALFESILHLNPDYVLAVAGLAVCSDNVQSLERIIARGSNSKEALGVMATLLKRKGDLDGVKNYAEKVLNLDPNNFSRTVELAEILEKKGNDLVAITYRKRAFELNPGDLSNYRGLVRLYADREIFDRVVFYTNWFVKVRGDEFPEVSENLKNLSVAYLRMRFRDFGYDFNGLGDSDSASAKKFAEEVFDICRRRKVSVSEIKWEEIFPKGSSIDYEGGSVPYDQGAANLNALNKVEDWIRNNLK